MDNTVEKLVSLCKRRGFIYQSSEIDDLDNLMKKNSVTGYIGFDSTNYGQQLAYDVCKRSIEKFNSDIEIKKLVKQDLVEKKLFWREDNSGVTEFTYTRFLVPYLNNYG